MRLARAHATQAGGRVLLLLFAAMLAFGIGVGGTLGMTAVVAGHDDPGRLHACVHPISGMMRYVTDPADCSRYEQVVSWAGTGGLHVRVRTAIARVPENVSGQASNSAFCEPGEIAISGGSRVIYDGAQAFVSWVKLDLGTGLVGTPPSGWVEGYSFSNTLPNTSVETWVLCVS